MKTSLNRQYKLVSHYFHVTLLKKTSRKIKYISKRMNLLSKNVFPFFSLFIYELIVDV